MNKVLILLLIAIITLANSKCEKGDAPDFNWHPSIYATDSETQSVVRGDEQIMCHQQEFNNLICMPAQDIVKSKKAYFDAINQCKTWKSKKAMIKVYEMGNNIDLELQ